MIFLFDYFSRIRCSRYREALISHIIQQVTSSQKKHTHKRQVLNSVLKGILGNKTPTLCEICCCWCCKVFSFSVDTISLNNIFLSPLKQNRVLFLIICQNPSSYLDSLMCHLKVSIPCCFIAFVGSVNINMLKYRIKIVCRINNCWLYTKWVTNLKYIVSSKLKYYWYYSSLFSMFGIIWPVHHELTRMHAHHQQKHSTSYASYLHVLTLISMSMQLQVVTWT